MSDLNLGQDQNRLQKALIGIGVDPSWALSIASAVVIISLAATGVYGLAKINQLTADTQLVISKIDKIRQDTEFVVSETNRIGAEIIKMTAEFSQL